MIPTDDRAAPPGLVSDLLGSCGLDGLPSLIATETLLDQVSRRMSEGARPCR